MVWTLAELRFHFYCSITGVLFSKELKPEECDATGDAMKYKSLLHTCFSDNNWQDAIKYT